MKNIFVAFLIFSSFVYSFVIFAENLPLTPEERMGVAYADMQ
jgi:hypothetical protein